MTSLPRQVPGDKLHNLANVVRAYDICLRLEDSLQQSVDNVNSHDDDDSSDVATKLIYIRILGYLIHYVPTDLGLKNLVQEITSCVDDTAVLAVGEMYYDHYIRAFRANRTCRRPEYNDTPPRLSFDSIQDHVLDTGLQETPQSHSQARELALIRDGYRCVVTKRYDLSSVKRIKEVADMVKRDPDAVVDPMHCAHIFSEHTNPSVEPGSPKRGCAAPLMWAVMRRLGYEELPDELNGSKVHRLENVMTVNPTFHIQFDSLDIWFEETTTPNEYRLGAFYPHGYPTVVTFSTHDPVNLPVPSPNYLAIHAACAKVAHFSGAGRRIDRLYKNMEDMTTLDLNGASAATLEHALFQLQTAGYGVSD